MDNKEFEYQVTMSLARELLDKGAITKDQYVKFNTKMMEKYEPKTGDLFTNIDLL